MILYECSMNLVPGPNLNFVTVYPVQLLRYAVNRRISIQDSEDFSLIEVRTRVTWNATLNSL